MEAVAAIKSFVVEYASVLSSVVTITGKEQTTAVHYVCTLNAVVTTPIPYNVAM